MTKLEKRIIKLVKADLITIAFRDVEDAHIALNLTQLAEQLTNLVETAND